MDSSFEISDSATLKKRKRGIQRPFAYKCNIIKKARVQGSAYINWKGKSVPSIPRGVDNDCKCRRKCYSLVSEEDRQEIFKRFRNLETKNEQDCYLQSLISINEVKHRRRRKNPEESSKPARGCSYTYVVSSSTCKVIVCKTAFVNIHGISPDRVRRLCLLLGEGKLPIDMRGYSTPGNTIPGYITDAVQEHISSFPVQTAHYATRDVNYLSEKLNITIMHNLFKQKYPDFKVSYHYYRQIFQEFFNLSFGKPQMDNCSLCEELSIEIKSSFSNNNARQAAIAKKMVHLHHSKKFSTPMIEITEKIKAEDSSCAITVDF